MGTKRNRDTEVGDWGRSGTSSYQRWAVKVVKPRQFLVLAWTHPGQPREKTPKRRDPTGETRECESPELGNRSVRACGIRIRSDNFAEDQIPPVARYWPLNSCDCIATRGCWNGQDCIYLGSVCRGPLHVEASSRALRHPTGRDIPLIKVIGTVCRNDGFPSGQIGGWIPEGYIQRACQTTTTGSVQVGFRPCGPTLHGRGSV
jgi:hypothetical protein